MHRVVSERALEDGEEVAPPTATCLTHSIFPTVTGTVQHGPDWNGAARRGVASHGATSHGTTPRCAGIQLSRLGPVLQLFVQDASALPVGTNHTAPPPQLEGGRREQ